MSQEPRRSNVGEPEDREPERADGEEPREETAHQAAGEAGHQTGREDHGGHAHGPDETVAAPHGDLDERTTHDAAPSQMDSAALDSEVEAGSVGGDANGVASSTEGASAAEPAQTTEAADDSLDSILLEAGARPLHRSADDGARPLDAVAAELRAASVEDGPELDVDFDDVVGGDDAPAAPPEANTPALIESRLTSQSSPTDEPQTAGLLEDVAQALDVQAAEYRDRARGRLPGMPGTPSAGPGSMAASSSDAAEFEDPEDPDKEPTTGLTPGIVSLEEDAEALAFQPSRDQQQDPFQEVTQKVATPSDPDAGASRKGAGHGDGRGVEVSSADRAEPRSSDRGDRIDGRPTVKVPPVPGISLATTSPLVGPPPGASRPTTPVSGLSLSSSGRLRLPTPGPVAGGLPPPSGRITLPPGTMAPLPTSRRRGDLSDTMPATPFSIEASRRNTAGLPIGSGSGRVSTRGNSRVTEPVIRQALSSSVTALLTAHVKLATLNLAGLIALTFAGGLLVGMLVWRGSGRGEQPAASRSLTTAASPSTGEPKPESKPEPKPEMKAETRTETNANATGESNVGPAPAVGAAVPAGAAAGAAAAALAVSHAERGQAAIVAPLPSSAAPAARTAGTAPAPAIPGPARRSATATRAPARAPHLAAVPSGAATTASNAPASPNVGANPGTSPPDAKTSAGAAKAPAPRTAALTASRPMAANNSSAKPGAKPKTKSTWKDPFAD